MSTRDESWGRLRAAAWNDAPGIARMMANAGASPQRLSGGVASVILDEYTTRLTRMPSGLTAEQLIVMFARSPNDAVSHGRFNTINEFRRRTPGTAPAVGDIYDIDLFGPDNGSVMTVQQSDGFGTQCVTTGAWFDVQAIETPETGSLPENGAREFGFEYAGSEVVFYTRGVSRVRDAMTGAVGKIPQQMGWIAAMTGIRDRVRRQGGTADEAISKVVRAVPPS